MTTPSSIASCWNGWRATSDAQERSVDDDDPSVCRHRRGGGARTICVAMTLSVTLDAGRQRRAVRCGGPIAAGARLCRHVRQRAVLHFRWWRELATRLAWRFRTSACCRWQWRRRARRTAARRSLPARSRATCIDPRTTARAGNRSQRCRCCRARPAGHFRRARGPATCAGSRPIAPDRHDPELLFVGIELGGVMRSTDGGLSWEDRKPNSQHDAHAVLTHPSAAGRVYEAAGGGVAYLARRRRNLARGVHRAEPALHLGSGGRSGGP